MSLSSDTIAWIEAELRVPQGHRVGQPFRVLPWQRSFTRAALAKNVREPALAISKGNGKSTFCAALGAAAVSGPLAQRRAEVVVVAGSFAQGKIVGKHVKELLQRSRFYRKGRYRIADSTVFRIEDLELGTTLHVLAQGRPDLMHGRAFSLCLLDEPASWSAGSSAEVHAALRTSIGKIPHAKMISLGTAPRDSSTWYGRLLESGGKGVHVYKADEEADPWDEAEWKAANPSWAFMPPLRKAIREEAEEVKIRPDLMPAFRAFRLNQGTDPTDTHRLVSQEEWRAIEEEGRGIKGGYVLALDWAGGYSMAAACAVDHTGRLDALCAFPGDKSLAVRGLQHGVGGEFVAMAREGNLVTLGNVLVEPEDFLQACIDRWGDGIDVILSDNYGERVIRNAMQKIGLRVPYIREPFGYQLTPRIRRFREAVRSGEVSVPRTLLLRKAVDNVQLLSSADGAAEKLKSKNKGGHDDAIVAALLAVSEYGFRRDKPTPAGGLLKVQSL